MFIFLLEKRLFMKMLNKNSSFFIKKLNKHTELSAPVADVILADDFVAFKFEHAANSIADNRASKMADMHLFCNIRAGKIDDDGFRILNLADAQPLRRISIDFKKPLGNKFRFKAEIYESWSCDFRRFANITYIKVTDYFFSKLARIGFK